MKKAMLIIIGILLLVFTGCQLNNPEDAGIAKKTPVKFACNLTGLMYKTMSKSVSRIRGITRSINYGTGVLHVTNIDTQAEQAFNWYFTYDDETLELISNKTIVLTPGIYDFMFDMTIASYQYVGTAGNVTIADGENTIAVSIHPVVGDTITNFDIHQIPYLRFKYPVDELSKLSNPRLGCIIDDQCENIIYFNMETGISDVYINLEAGDYNIKLKLYDENIQVGKSIPSQENCMIIPAQNLVMDLVPLHGETIFQFSHDGGQAGFIFNIPSEVVEEVNGVENLSTYFILYGTINGMVERELTFTLSENGYTAEVLFDQFYYDTVTFTLTFIDNRTMEFIGGCGKDELVLNKDTQSIELYMELIRRALVQGNLLGVLGVHVIDENNIPQAGVSIYIDDILYGITGSGVFGTPGYLKTYLKKGTYRIKVKKDNYETITTIGIESFSVDNIEIILNMEDQKNEAPTGE